VGGKVITRREQFKNGSASLAFVVPKTAKGKLLTVKVTIKANAGSANRVATFPVR
jgi:hypothetical protein